MNITQTPVLTMDDLLAHPDYDANRPVLVSLTLILQNAVDSVDCYDLSTTEGWQSMMRSKCADTGFQRLLDSMMEKGHLREGAIGFNTDNESGWHAGPYISEGHHRLSAAILLGLDYVWVSKYGKEWYVNGSRICAHSSADANGGLDLGWD